MKYALLLLFIAFFLSCSDSEKYVWQAVGWNGDSTFVIKTTVAYRCSGNFGQTRHWCEDNWQVTTCLEHQIDSTKSAHYANATRYIDSTNRADSLREVYNKKYNQ